MRKPQSRARAVRTLCVAVPALVLLTLVGMRDAPAALALAGLGVLVAGVLVLTGRMPATAGRLGRRGALAALALGSAGLFAGGTAFGAPAVPAGGLSARVAAPAPTTAFAVDALAALPVKGAAPMTGYVRTQRFGAAWLDVDRNGCDTRDDVLRRDLTNRSETRCTVRAGVLHDPYTGKTIHFVRGQHTSAAVQIDHVVALADAWRTGAQRLPQAQRVALANDPMNLLAVDGPTNTQKSDGDAATWLPKQKAYRCAYVARQVAVKRAYGLWVVPAERAAIARVLATCPGQRVPAASRVTPASRVTAVAPAAAVTPSLTVQSAPVAVPGAVVSSPVPSAVPSTVPSAVPSAVVVPEGPIVSPGAFCSPAGARGRTSAGTAMACLTSAVDVRNRWRAAG